jgi:hypothetical protein
MRAQGPSGDRGREESPEPFFSEAIAYSLFYFVFFIV